MILSKRMNATILQSEVEDIACAYDLIIVGLGTAGALAAITAGQLGLKVLGIERLNCLGGTGTTGGILPYYYGASGGAYEKVDALVDEMQKLGYTKAMGQNPEIKKYVLEQEAQKYDVEIIFEAVLTGVFLEGNRVRGVQWFEDANLKQAGAKVVMDCTGEAEVCALAGSQTRFGRILDGRVQPFSNVQLELYDGAEQCYRATDCGTFRQLDGAAYAKAHVNSATLPMYYADAYNEHRQLIGFMTLMGIREGRLIVGEETVTLKDFLDDKLTDKPLFYAYSNLDNHGKDLAFESETMQDWIVGANLWGMKFSVPIPMGALIPKGFEGLLVAGRCIAVDHDIAPCVRMKRDMQKCGEAAAVVAYVAIKNDERLSEVAYEEIKPILLSTHCLDEKNHVPFTWLTEEEEIKAGLQSTKPGIAIWSAKRLQLTDNLTEWCLSNDSHLARNSAFALGLLGHNAAIPVLRKIVVERDDFIPDSSMKYCHVCWHSALYLLGRLRDAGSIDLLFEVMNSDVENKNHINNELIFDDRDYSFQAVSQAMMALLKIAEAHTQHKKEIYGKLKEVVLSNEFHVGLTLKGGGNVPYDMTTQVQEILTALGIEI